MLAVKGAIMMLRMTLAVRISMPIACPGRGF
jgi:hypothetical protein